MPSASDRAASARPWSSRSSNRSAMSAAAVLCATTPAASATQKAALERARCARARSRPSASLDQPVQVLQRVGEPRRVDQRRGPSEPGADQEIAIGDAFGDLDRLAEQDDRLLFGPGSRRDVGRHHQIHRRLRVVTGFAIVVCQDRRGIPDAVTRLALDERCDRPVTLASRGSWQRPVRNLAREHMLEDELAIGRNARRRLPPDEVSPLQIVQGRVQIGVIALERRERTPPEDAPDHRGVLEHLPVLTRERVQASGDDRLHRRGQPGDEVGRALGDGRRQLLEEQRVAAARVDETVRVPRGLLRPREQRADELVCVLVIERLQVDRRVPREPAAPRRLRVEEIRPRQRDQEHRYVGQA